jgi:para-aminobenzoate synthetase component 1
MTRLSARRSRPRSLELPFEAPHRVARALRARRTPGVSLLESALDVDGLGRFSFVAARPIERVAGGDLAGLRRKLEELRPAHELARALDIPFAGGAVLVLAYDYGRRLERWPSHARPLEDAVPDLLALVHDSVLVWDHARGRALYVGSGERGGLSAAEARAAFAAARGGGEGAEAAGGALPGRREPVWNFTRQGYERAVARVRRYIRAGDVFQVNLSQRFETTCDDADALYERLRAASPAPFMADLELGAGRRLVSSSPELFLRLDGAGRVESWPIKGTRPRGETPAEDRRLRSELLASRKEAAELAMIVDLVRNDLGRVARPGSVRVREARRAQAWPTVHHTTAVVEARLEEGARWDDLVAAAFPPASVTGAPKLRACEIIDELEPVRRGIYTGAFGWVSWEGALELAVAIRTLLLAGRRVHGHVGGGITLRSSPRHELEETFVKARGLLRALHGEDGARTRVAR